LAHVENTLTEHTYGSAPIYITYARKTA
jgi:hypothetical protein